jgi:hypothetical protein
MEKGAGGGIVSLLAAKGETEAVETGATGPKGLRAKAEQDENGEDEQSLKVIHRRKMEMPRGGIEPPRRPFQGRTLPLSYLGSTTK